MLPLVLALALVLVLPHAMVIVAACYVLWGPAVWLLSGLSRSRASAAGSPLEPGSEEAVDAPPLR